MSGSRAHVMSIRDVFARCDSLRGQGKVVIDAHIGAPSHDPPLPVEDVLQRAKGLGRAYTPFVGTKSTRKAAAEFAARTLGVPEDSDRVVITASGAHACFVSMALFRRETILLPKPGFPLYYPQAELAGVRYDTYDPLSEDLVEEILSKLSDDVKGVLINFPNNPTGHIPRAKQIEELWEELSKKGVVLINDAVYHEIYFEDKPPFPGDLILDTASKSLSLPGIRIGYIYSSDRETAQKIGRIVYHTTAGSSDVSQLIFTEEVRAADEVYFKRVREFYRVRRDALVGALKRLGFEFVEPKGAFYVFAKHPKFPDASELVARLLDPSRDVIVGLVPGAAFGATPEWMRISYGKLTTGDVELMERELRKELG